MTEDNITTQAIIEALCKRAEEKHDSFKLHGSQITIGCFQSDKHNNVELKRQLKSEAECWLLEEWRRISLPEWRRILQESIDSHDTKREEYARYILREILEDSEYVEKHNND